METTAIFEQGLQPATFQVAIQVAHEELQELE
jgi:hypothetical protein